MAARKYKTKPKWGRMDTKFGVPWKRIHRCLYCYEFVSRTANVCAPCKAKADKARDAFCRFIFRRRDLIAS